MSVVEPTGVYLFDFFYSSIQLYILLSPYLCFISFLYLVTCRKRVNILAILYVMFFLCVCFFSLPMWCPVSGVEVDCIDS